MIKKTHVVIAVIILIGIVIVSTIGFKGDVSSFAKNTQIVIGIETAFEIKDVKSIVNEIFIDEHIGVQYVGLFEDIVLIKVVQRTEEELNTKLEELNNKINEKYEIENTVDDMIISNNPTIRLRDVVKPYIIPSLISLSIVVGYFMIRYRRLGIIKTISTYMLMLGAVLGVVISVIAIARIPVTVYTIPTLLLIYIFTSLVACGIFEKKIIDIYETDI